MSPHTVKSNLQSLVLLLYVKCSEFPETAFEINLTVLQLVFLSTEIHFRTKTEHK